MEDVKQVPQQEQENQVPNVEVIDVAAEEVANIPLRKFKVGVHQVLEDGSENSHTLSFSLPDDKAKRLGIILGTTINRMFARMALSKTFKSTFIKGTQPLVLKVEAEHWPNAMEIGKVTEEQTEVLKLNNGLLSKRSFVDKVVDLVNFTNSEIKVVDIADLKQEINDILWVEQPKIKNEGVKSVAATRHAANREVVLN